MTDNKIPLGAAMRDAFPELQAPDDLREWARKLSADHSPESNNVERLPAGRGSHRTHVRTPLLYAAGLILACALGWGARASIRGSSSATQARVAASDAVATELVDNHIRSLMGDHLMDVRSTDQHTVKPWFEGRTDFAPRVVDLAPQGFPLLGGRLEYAAGHTIAALVFGRRKHIINLYEWPTSESTDMSEQPRSVKGYAVLHWVSNGLSYWAVTDASAVDLMALRGSFTQAQ